MWAVSAPRSCWLSSRTISDRDFDHAQNSVDRGEKTLEKMHNAYLKERQKTIKHYAPDLVGYAANYNTANSHGDRTQDAPAKAAR